MSEEKDTYLFGFRELVARDFAGLNDYLGLELDDPTLEGWIGKLSRRGSTGDWVNWFTQRDVEFFKPALDPIVRRLGLPGWERPDHVEIDPRHCTEYIAKLIKASLSDPLRGGEDLSIDRLRSAAEDGKATAIQRLAVMYRDGSGVPRDLEKSGELFWRAALLGKPSSAVAAGLVFMRLGSWRRAIESFEEAAELEHPVGQLAASLAQVKRGQFQRASRSARRGAKGTLVRVRRHVANRLLAESR